MGKTQYAIMRFAKYKGSAIGGIEAHDERTKEKYASNPDVDANRSHLNFHIIEPQGKYCAEADRQITEAGCRTRKDSVRVVETLITASPEVFKGMKQAEIRAFFQRAVDFIKSKQAPETILSAVVHMDEKTPHMHLSFVPLTKDGRLSAKEIIGNRQTLVKWQDGFWEHMVKQYPNLERGESASETGRDHIPPRLFKEAAHLGRQQDALMQLIEEVNPLNAKRKGQEIERFIEKYIPNVEAMKTRLKKYESTYQQLKADNAALEQKLKDGKESVIERMETLQKLQEFDNLKRVVERVPKEILEQYKKVRTKQQTKVRGEGRDA